MRFIGWRSDTEDTFDPGTFAWKNAEQQTLKRSKFLNYYSYAYRRRLAIQIRRYKVPDSPS